MNVFTTPSEHARAVLSRLKAKHNVLIAGPPATGKSRLLAEVRHWFQKPPAPAYRAEGRSPFPVGERGDELRDAMPSPERTDRKVFQITFHQGTKHRDFVSGLVPSTKKGEAMFKVATGPLLHACEHGLTAHGAALVEIDEINRGPAVAIFGDTINAIEPDKRLLPDGKESSLTWKFRSIRADGEPQELGIPHHVYLLAAMNQADTSVEPLDVAFLRRFEVYVLSPDEAAVRAYFALSPPTNTVLPPTAGAPADVLEACVLAWRRVNERISLARGPEFQIGHGIFMEASPSGAVTDSDKAVKIASQVWSRIFTHVSEVFFGDTRGLAAAVRAGTQGHPFTLEELEFADSVMPKLSQSRVDATNIYGLLKATAATE